MECIPFLRATCQVLRIAPHSLVRHLRKSCFSPSVLTLPWADDPVYTCLHSVRRASFWRASPSSQTAEESAHAFAPSVKFSLELLRFPLAPTKARISYSLHVFPSLWVCRFLCFASRCFHRRIKSLQWHSYSNISFIKLRLCLLNTDQLSG